VGVTPPPAAIANTKANANDITNTSTNSLPETKSGVFDCRLILWHNRPEDLPRRGMNVG